MTIDENFDLKGIMKNYLLSQKDVGKIVGVSRQFIGSVLSGKKTLSPEKKQILLDYLSYDSKYELETSVDYLRIRLKTLKWFEVIEGLLLMDSNLFNIDVSSMHNYNMSSLLTELGIPIKVIMQRVGHRDEKTTLQIYTHVTEKMESDVDDKMNSFEI